MIWSTEQQSEKSIWLWIALASMAGTTSALAAAFTPNPLFIVAGVGAFLILILTLQQPKLGLAVLIFMTYARVSDVLVNHHGFPSIAKFFVPFLLLIVITRWLLFKERPTGWEQALTTIGPYVLVAASTLFFARDQIRIANELEQLVKDLLIVVAITILLKKGNTLRSVIYALLAAGLFLGSISVYQQLTGSFDNKFWGFGVAEAMHIVGSHSSARIAGPLGTNFYAMVMVVLVPLALERAWHEKNLVLRAIAIWALVACVLTVIFTFSRGGFLALCVVLGLTCLRHPPKPMVLLIAGLAIFAMIPLLPAQYMARMSTLPDALPFGGGGEGNSVLVEEISFRGRLSEVTAAVQMFGDHPLLGVGLGNYNANYLDYSRGLGLDGRLEARSAHSLYLEVAAETGILGLMAFGLILWRAFASMHATLHRLEQAQSNEYANLVAAFRTGVVGYLTGSLFLHGTHPRYFWLLMGIAFAISHVARYEAGMRRHPLQYECKTD